MPIYEYVCSNCGTSIELLQKINSLAPEKCAKCEKKNSMVKAVSQTSFSLKGGGWYKDLYSSTKKSDSSDKPSSKKDSPSTKKEAPKKSKPKE